MNKLCFSFITGEIFEITEDDIKHITNEQVILKSKPSSSCKKCYGRLYTGKHKTFDRELNKWSEDYYTPCLKCLKKYIDQDALIQSLEKKNTVDGFTLQTDNLERDTNAIEIS
jgi:hypothetical protein